MTSPTLFRVFNKDIDLATAISIAALAFSGFSLYYSYQSELRQLEQLVVSGGETFEISEDARDFVISKAFSITNISERVVAVQRIRFELSRAEGVQYSTRYAINVGGKDVSWVDELNALIKPGDSISAVVTFVPTMGKRAAEFFANHKTGTNFDKIAALCKTQGIDFYDNELNSAQVQLCPSYRTYRGKYNKQFGLGSGSNGDTFMLIVDTYRDSSFSSDRYKLEIGNSKL